MQNTGTVLFSTQDQNSSGCSSMTGNEKVNEQFSQSSQLSSPRSIDSNSETTDTDELESLPDTHLLKDKYYLTVPNFPNYPPNPLDGTEEWLVWDSSQKDWVFKPENYGEEPELELPDEFTLDNFGPAAFENTPFVRLPPSRWLDEYVKFLQSRNSNDAIQ